MHFKHHFFFWNVENARVRTPPQKWDFPHFFFFFFLTGSLMLSFSMHPTLHWFIFLCIWVQVKWMNVLEIPAQKHTVLNFLVAKRLSFYEFTDWCTSQVRKNPQKLISWKNNHPRTKKCSFLCNKRGPIIFFPNFSLLGLVQGPPKYIPSKKIEIFEGAPWSPPSMKKMFIFNKKGPFLCYKIFPLIFFPNFFTIGCLGGGLKKYIFFNLFEGVKKIRIALNHP